MKITKKLASLFIASTFFVGYLVAITIGTDNVVSRNAPVSFPAVDTNNQINGFAAFDKGFSLASQLTTCTYNAFFPTGVNIRLNGGTLYLLEDFNLMEPLDLQTSGTINAQFKSILFSGASTQQLVLGNLGGLIFKNTQLLFNSNVIILAPIRFIGSNIINAQDFSLTLSTGGGIIVGENSSLLIENAVINNITGTTIFCVDSTGTLALSNVQWNQSGDTVFNTGQLAIVGDTVMTGSTTFTYSSPQISTVYAPATWSFDRGMTFSYASAANNCIAFENRFSTLHLYEAMLYAHSPGLTLTKGTLALEGQCLLVGNAATAANGIWIGDGISSSNNMRLRVLAESGIYTGTGYVVYANIN